MELTPALVVIALSEIVALWLIVRIWRSADPLVFKFALTALAIVPFFGPLFVVWASNFPPRLPESLRDRAPKTADLFDSWRPELQRRGLMEPFKAFRTLFSGESRNDRP